MGALPARLEIGRIGRPHGLRGEVTVTLLSDRPERTAVGAPLYANDVAVIVETARRHRDGWLIRFAGVTDREGAEALRGAVLSGDPLEMDSHEGAEPGATSADAEVWWVHELVGCAVSDREGRTYGRVAAIQANPAHDLLVLDGGALVPLPFVVERGEGRVVIDPPEGLFDL